MDNGVISIIIVLLLALCGWTYVLWKNSRKMHEVINLTAQQHHLVRHDTRVRALCRAIRILNPNVTPGIDYVIRHDTPEQEPYIAEWMSSATRPTEEEIKAALLEIADIHHEDKFASIRRAEYPSVEEQLDAAYLARQGDNTKQLEIDEKIRRVKEEHPKSDECGI
jgi:hypothetical protein